MNKILFYILLFTAFFSGTYAQQQYSSTNKRAIEQYEKAVQYFNARTIVSARDAVKKALLIDPAFADAYILLGNAQALLGDKEAAIAAFNKQIELKPELSKITYLSKGKIEFETQKFADALISFTKLAGYTDNSPKTKKELEKYLRDAAFAAEAIKTPVDYKPINMGFGVNSRNAEYTPAITADNTTLIFTRQVMNQEDFYTSIQKDSVWQPAISLSAQVNTPNFNEGAQSLSPDGKYLFITICGKPDGQGGCDLYLSQKRENNWTPPLNLGNSINTPYQERQPAISADGNTLYFISNRPGGVGGEDIWMSTYLTDGKWAAPKNLGATVNSSGTEQSPFIHPDNQTLYFSSDGWPGMGLQDLFYSKKQADGTFAIPVNAGYPINTINEERSLIVSTDGMYGFVSSNAEGSFGGFDIYYFKIPQSLKPQPTTFVKGTVFDKIDKRKIAAKIEVISLRDNKLVYTEKSNTLTGEFIACLPVGQNYALNVSSEGYLFYSDNFALDNPTTVLKPFLLDVPLQKITVGQTMVLRNIFYKLNSAELSSESKVELDKIVAFMQLNEAVKIELSGHSDNTGNEQLNNALSQNRAKSVYDYVVKAGIDDTRLVYKGYGKSQPIAENDTEEGRAKNRRTEMKIL